MCVCQDLTTAQTQHPPSAGLQVEAASFSLVLLLAQLQRMVVDGEDIQRLLNAEIESQVWLQRAVTEITYKKKGRST